MEFYKVRVKKLAGTNDHEIYAKAFAIYKTIKKRSKRRTYVRSAYFKNDKIFLDLFWQHLWQKNWGDRTRRLKYFACAIELIQHSRKEPISKQNPNRGSEILHRFGGMAQEGDCFFIQIKEAKKTNQKWFMSVFPKNE